MTPELTFGINFSKGLAGVTASSTQEEIKFSEPT